jgi:short-subunit dehydrogenase
VELAGARVLLTGASSGIGAALAPLLAERGAVVAVTARRADRLDEVLTRCREHTPSSCRYVADLADPDGAQPLARRVEDDLGGVEVLVANHGAPMRRRAPELTVAELRRTMAVNFESPARMAMALLPGMLARDRGSIVNVSSFGGRAGIPGEPAYCASKFALAGWSESLALDLWGTGVEVRLVLPGAVDTEIWDRPGNDPAAYGGPKAPPQEVAAGIVAAIEGDRFEHYLPDLSSVVAFKTASIDEYLAGTAAFAAGAHDPSGDEPPG